MVTTIKIKETATTNEYHYYVENHKSTPADIGRIVFKKAGGATTWSAENDPREIYLTHAMRSLLRVKIDTGVLPDKSSEAWY